MHKSVWSHYNVIGLDTYAKNKKGRTFWIVRPFTYPLFGEALKKSL